MEDLKYDYVELGLPNILARFDKNDPKLPIEIQPFMKPFVEALAKKYPNWRFVCRAYWQRHRDRIDGTSYKYGEAGMFMIFDGREALGEISRGYGRRNADAYVISNERIREARERGSDTKTQDLNKAIKIVGKMFGSKTIAERLEEARQKATDITWRVYNDRATTFTRMYDNVVVKLTKHVMANWETISAIALQEGVDPNIVSSMPDAYNENKITERIYKCNSQGTGAVVLIHGNDYAVLARNASGDDTVSVYSTDTLPAHIKVAVGMLKLLEPNKFIADVGVKLSDTSFFVSKEASV